MATSGTTTYSVTRDDVIQEAMELMKLLNEGETPSSYQLTTLSRTLNLMLKAWVKRGAQLWKIRYFQVPMVSGVVQYPLGNTAGYVYSATITTAGTGGTPGSYALGFSGGGGTGAAGTYTIGAGGTLSSIAITAGGSSYTSAPSLSFPSGGISGAAATATIVGLTGTRPLRVLEAFIRNNAVSPAQDIPLILLSRNEYNLLGTKGNSARPNQFYYDAQLTNGQLYVFPQPISSDNVTIHATVQIPIEDMSAASNDFDLPQEWFKCAAYGLASEAGPKFISDVNRLQWLTSVYQDELQQCFDWSVEESSIFFTVNPQAYERRR